MYIKNLSQSLNPIEKKVIRVLDNFSSFQDIVKVTELKDVEVMRALQWLQNKNVIKIKEKQEELVVLDENGQRYLKDGLPERRLLEAINKIISLTELAKKTILTYEEMTISLGVLKSKNAIEINKDKEVAVSITDNGRHLLKHGFLEEQFLKENFPRELKSLNEEEKFVFENLRKKSYFLLKNQIVIGLCFILIFINP